MFTILYALGMLVVDLFKSRRRLEAENLFLRHQLSIAGVLRQRSASNPGTRGAFYFSLNGKLALHFTVWELIQGIFIALFGAPLNLSCLDCQCDKRG